MTPFKEGSASNSVTPSVYAGHTATRRLRPAKSSSIQHGQSASVTIGPVRTVVASSLTCMSRAPVKRRTSSRARIIESVTTILESGVRYADVPVERILTTANVSRSTFYQWFADKGDLIESAAEPFFAAFWDVSDKWWMRTEALGPDDLADIITRMFQLGREHGPVWRAFLETVDADARLRNQFGSFLEVYTAKIADRLRRDRDEGVAPADMDPEQTARFITVTTRGSLLDLINAPEERDADFAAALAGGFWQAMYGSPSDAPKSVADQSNSIASDPDDGVA